MRLFGKALKSTPPTPFYRSNRHPRERRRITKGRTFYPFIKITTMGSPKKKKKRFEKFKKSRRIVDFETASKTPDDYPFLSTYDDLKINFILLYEPRGFLIHFHDEHQKAWYIVPEEGMEPHILLLQEAEEELFDY